jgi:hypothetical protein
MKTARREIGGPFVFIPLERIVNAMNSSASMVLQILSGENIDPTNAFVQNFGGDYTHFAVPTGAAIDAWETWREKIDDNDQNKVMVAAIAFTVINQNILSFKLFMSGYTVGAGALFRQVLEGMALAYLCSSKELNVLEQFINDKYSTNKAVGQLTRNAEKIHVRRQALQSLNKAYEFYHKYAHPSKLAMAAGANFDNGGVPNIGPFFDPEKLKEYAKEVKGRISFAKTLPGTIAGLERNLSEW